MCLLDVQLQRVSLTNAPTNCSLKPGTVFVPHLPLTSPRQWPSQRGPLTQGLSQETQLSHGQLYLKEPQEAFPNLALSKILPPNLPSLSPSLTVRSASQSTAQPDFSGLPPSFSLIGRYPCGCLHVWFCLSFCSLLSRRTWPHTAGVGRSEEKQSGCPGKGPEA